MRRRFGFGVGMLLVSLTVAFVHQVPVQAGEENVAGEYRVLDPIRHGNLTIFPVTAARVYDTAEFLTLDEGLRSGEVVVSEYGSLQGLIRRHPVPILRDGAQVNKLVLVNNSKRPLLLLAGEVVTGGKQDRVIGKDRIVPAEGDPVDLSVFCVEPGRWVATSTHFGTSGSMYGKNDTAVVPGTMMVQPSVRAKAMADRDQNQVWDAVRRQQEAVRVQVEASAPAAAAQVAGTSSYARVMENAAVRKEVDAVAKPIEQNYQSVIRELRNRKAVGVVAAVNGRIVWADIFASSSLLEKYWPKLVRSYASEAVVTRAKEVEISTKQAQDFLADFEGRKEVIENEPGLYRHAEIDGEGFRAFALTSLLPKTGFEVHVAKMVE